MSIAEKLTIIANNTTDVFVSGYNAGYAEGEEWGFSEGWVDNESMVASALNSPVQKVEAYVPEECMAVDSMGQIQYLDENIPNVYDKGVYDGVADGRQAEYDRFWNAYQDNGAVISGEYAFAGPRWSDATYNPKYPIKVTVYTNMYRSSAITDTKVALDISDGTGGYTFYLTQALKTIPMLIVSEKNTFVSCFHYTSCLENITIGGVIGNDINFQYSPLSKASIASVVNALSETVSGMTVTFKESAVTDAFGSTTAQEWLDLTATKSNWTISLV